ncbi:MAG: STAS domain-containing protein [Planctomycetes bacterium]|nr:STAS domain-containing protein [Planctomycetota bacterium]
MSGYEGLQVGQHDGVTVVELDTALLERNEVLDFVDSLIAFVETEQPAKLLIDFRKVTRFSSEAIGGLIRANRRILGYNGKLKLCGMSPLVRMVFGISRLDGTVFTIHDAASDAVAAFQA